MKKYIALILAVMFVLSFAACGKTEPADTQPAATESNAPAATEPADVTEPADTQPAPASVMSYAEYVAAEVDAPVTIEAAVQATQSWWDNKVTAYLADEDGAYFVYNMTCAEEDYSKLELGTVIRVTGYKSEWSGEVEIIDAVFEILDEEKFYSQPADVTALIGNDEQLAQHMNQRVTFNGMTVEASTDADGKEVAFLYNYDGSGSRESNSDLYFKVAKDGVTYTFTVESYLCDSESEVYKTVENLKVGDVINVEGFLYWYEGVNPHIYVVTPAA